MKKLLLLCILFISCKKNADKEPTSVITVLDRISNTPVEGASVYLYACGALGCDVSAKTIFSEKTGKDGVVNVPTAVYWDITNQLNVSKATYLGFETQRGSTLFLRPKGWIRLRIVRGGIYPPGSSLIFIILAASETVVASTPADSTLVLVGAGGLLNKVYWYVVDKQNQQLTEGLTQVQLPRLDTTNVLLNY